MATLPIAPVVLPLDLVGQENGQLVAKLLTDVGPSGKLHHLAARAFRALAAAAWNQGLPLTYTYGGTYRTYAAQEALFLSRYSPTGTGGGCKTWNGERWCKKSSNLATAAVPGTSNHGWGLAIDTAFDTDVSDGVGPDDAAGITGHPQWPWFLANAARFGFSWELQSEPWHIRYVAGDTIPYAVLEFEGAVPKPDPTPPPTGDPIVYIAAPGPAISGRTDVHFAVYESGIVRHASGTDVVSGVEVRTIQGAEHFNQLARAANHMSGAGITLL